MSIEVVNVNHKDAVEVIVTAQADSRNELTSGIVRKELQNKMAAEYAMVGYGIEAYSQPYPYDVKNDQPPPFIKEGNSALFSGDSVIKYRQEFRMRRSL